MRSFDSLLSLESEEMTVMCLRNKFIKKNGKKNDIVHLSNYPHPPGLIVTAERVTNHIN